MAIKRMRKQCVPGTLSPPPPPHLGTRLEERGEGRREEGRERGKMVDQKRRRMSHPKANGNLRL